jgi:hypothetical protein
LVIHCSDPRYQAHFQEFLHRRLALDSYELIAVPGGPQFLTLLDYLPKFSWVGWRWVKFLVDVAQPKEVILIAHEDCRWYRDSRFALLAGDARGRALADLRSVRAAVIERFRLPVRLYFARLTGQHVVFEVA